MARRNVRIIPKRRDLDLDKLVQGLLDLVDSLTPEQLEYFAADGERLLEALTDGEQKRNPA